MGIGLLDPAIAVGGIDGGQAVALDTILVDVFFGLVQVLPAHVDLSMVEGVGAQGLVQFLAVGIGIFQLEQNVARSLQRFGRLAGIGTRDIDLGNHLQRLGALHQGGRADVGVACR